MARISGEEKEKAVEFFIAHDRDYALTAERFGFTYQQIYGWVRKYHAAGLNSLREDRECSRELSDWVIENSAENRRKPGYAAFPLPQRSRYV